MATWGKIDSEVKRVGKATSFPPVICGQGERITFRDTIVHNSGVSPDKFHKTMDVGSSNVTAKYFPETPRGHWEIEAVAGSVKEVRELVNKMLTNLSLHDTHLS